jgi:hypothetical protein
MDSVRLRLRRAGLALFVFALIACGQLPGEPGTDTDTSTATDTNVAGDPPDTTPPPVVTPPPVQEPGEPTGPVVAALWEKSHPVDGPNWTSYAYEVVRDLGPKLVAGTGDVAQFCPNYAALSGQQKISFWVYLVSAVTKFESGYDPTNRYKESTMGTDPVTKQPVYSEGLLQLSYQDSLNYSFCNEFDWSKDKLLSATNPQKTILDPYKNLKCGIQIMNKIMGSHKLIAFGSGHYWSVLKTSSSRNHVAEIKTLTNSILFCRK